MEKINYFNFNLKDLKKTYLCIIIFLLLFGCSAEKNISDNCFVLYTNKEYDKSLECTEEGLKKYPNNPLLHYTRAHIYFLKNKIYLAINDMEEAIKNYELLQDEYKNYLRIENLYGLLGIFYDSVKNYNKAIECYNKALDYEPFNYIALRQIGYTYSKLNDHHTAISYYKNALHIKKDDEISLALLGISYYKLDILDTALLHLNKAIELAPTSYYDIYYYRGDIHYKFGEYEKALSDFEKANEIYTMYNNDEDFFNELKSKIDIVKNKLK